jgi:pantetheine-phosphate adenylyltransferase
MNKKIAVYPGTFDPVTKGHEALVLKALPLFDEIIIAIGHNSNKKTYFTLEQRKKWLEQIFQKYSQVKIDTYDTLTVNFCKEKQAQFILRGLRSSTDFEFEKNIAQANSSISPEIETVFLLSSPGLSAINSSIVRDVHRHGGDISQFIPNGIIIE